MNNEILLSERLDQEQADLLYNKVKEVMNDIGPELLINFILVDYINSAGIGGVISVLKALSENKKTIRLINLKPHILSVFKIAGLTKILNIKES